MQRNEQKKEKHTGLNSQGNEQKTTDADYENLHQIPGLVEVSPSWQGSWN